MAEVVTLKPKEPDKNEPFVQGSTVRLAGGDVPMTVRKAGKLSVLVDWHDETKNLCSAEFPPAMLRHADPNTDEEEARE